MTKIINGLRFDMFKTSVKFCIMSFVNNQIKNVNIPNPIKYNEDNNRIDSIVWILDDISLLKKVSKNKYIVNIKKFIIISVFIIIILILFVKDHFIKLFLLSFFILIIVSFYFWIFIKVVEKSCMYKYVEPQQLTEGDWIAKDVKIDGKYITGPKDLGIEKKQIKNQNLRVIGRILIM